MIPLYDITESRIDSRIIPDRAGETNEFSENYAAKHTEKGDESCQMRKSLS